MGRFLSIRAGLFNGVSFQRTYGSQGGYFSKIEGDYEMPVQAASHELFQKPVGCFMDIGAAEGYYAVGIAKLFPTLKVVAFELEKCLRYAMRRQAIENGVGNIEIMGRCSDELLQALIPQGETVILCDVEGYEDVLIEPDRVPKLKACSMVVELHEEYAPGVTERLQQRFSTTHHCRVVRQSGENEADGEPRGIDGAPAYIKEGRRQNGEWMILSPKR